MFHMNTAALFSDTYLYKLNIYNYDQIKFLLDKIHIQSIADILLFKIKFCLNIYSFSYNMGTQNKVFISEYNIHLLYNNVSLVRPAICVYIYIYIA